MIQDVRLGTDLIRVARLEASHRRFGMALFERLLTAEELAYCQAHRGGKRTDRFLQRAAGRIATKEAVAKALGVGLNGLGWSHGVGWQEIELLSAPNQPPAIRLHGSARAAAERLQIGDWRISLSHDGEYAMASAIGLIQP